MIHQVALQHGLTAVREMVKLFMFGVVFTQRHPCVKLAKHEGKMIL